MDDETGLVSFCKEEHKVRVLRDVWELLGHVVELALVEAFEDYFVALVPRQDKSVSIVVSVLIVLQEPALNLEAPGHDLVPAGGAIVELVVRAGDDVDLVVGGEHADVEAAIAVLRAEHLDDFRTEFHVVQPPILQHVEQGEVLSMRHEDVGADEDKAAEELAVALDALVEDVLEVEVALHQV